MNKEALDAVDAVIKAYSKDIADSIGVTDQSDQINILAALVAARAQIRD